MTASHNTYTPFALTAADGCVLQARRFSPVVEPLGQLVIAGATGVPQRFYARFAEFVMTLNPAVIPSLGVLGQAWAGR